MDRQMREVSKNGRRGDMQGVREDGRKGEGAEQQMPTMKKAYFACLVWTAKGIKIGWLAG
jgi:hypothetical protein